MTSYNMQSLFQIETTHYKHKFKIIKFRYTITNIFKIKLLSYKGTIS